MSGIDLNNESAAVLLRCLAYGQSAISQVQVDSDEEKVITENIDLIRQQVCRFLSRVIIEEATDKQANSK